MKLRTSALLAATSLAGCATMHKAKVANHKAIAELHAAHKSFPTGIKTVKRPYLMGSEVKVKKPESPVLKRRISLLIAQPESVREVASRISQESNIPVDVTGLDGGGAGGNSGGSGSSGRSSGALPPPPTSMVSRSGGSQSSGLPKISLRTPYHGSLSGLLNLIAARAGVSWKFENGRIKLFRYETRTFSIPALGWSTKSKSKISATSGSGQSSGGGLSSGGVGGGASSSSGSSSGSTSIQNKSDVDIWKGLEKTAKAVSGGAHVIADPATGTMTVTGRPDQIQEVHSWVKQLSSSLSQQVAITVRIFDVQEKRSEQNSFKPTLALKTAAQAVGVTMAGAPAPAIQGGSTPFSFGAAILKSATGQAGALKGTAAAVKALSTLGHVTQVFTRSIVTLNGRPAPIQVAKNTAYLRESETTQTANVGSVSGLRPGNVTTGFTGTFIPRIEGKRILLGMNMTISSLQQMKTKTSGNGSIQLPTTTDTQVQQSASLQSGSTLMVTGFQQTDGSTNHQGVGSPNFPFLGGGASAQVDHTMVAIVITARKL